MGSHPESTPGASGSWTFLTNHGHVLLAVALNPDIRVKDLALTVGITTRHALLILSDLEEAGYVHRERVGRETRYTVNSSRPFRHPTAAAHQVQELIAIFAQDPGPSRVPDARPGTTGAGTTGSGTTGAGTTGAGTTEPQTTGAGTTGAGTTGAGTTGAGTTGARTTGAQTTGPQTTEPQTNGPRGPLPSIGET